jgi:hypothetical protein
MSPSRFASLNVVAALTCALASPAWSNGDRFFQSKEIPGNAEFVIFGAVKDEQGKYCANATVTVSVPLHQLEFIVETDILGRFRTPDIGRAIKEVGYDVDPSLLRITVDYRGFQLDRLEYRGKYGQKKGAVEVNLRMKRDGT